MNWEDERYVRLYTRDTVEWNMLPWQSRALWPQLLRKFDRSGVIDLGKYGTRGLSELVKLPLEVTEPGLKGLLDDGCIVLRATLLIAPNFIPAQEATASDAARAKLYRERKRAEAMNKPSQNVTEPSRNVNESSRGVTDRHEANESSLLAVPSLAVPSERISLSDARARVIKNFQSRHILMPDADSVNQVLRLITEYAGKSSGGPEEIIDRAFAAFDKLSATWKVNRFTARLFSKHWEEIQRVMGGVDPSIREPANSKPAQTGHRSGIPNAEETAAHLAHYEKLKETAVPPPPEFLALLKR